MHHEISDEWRRLEELFAAQNTDELVRELEKLQLPYDQDKKQEEQAFAPTLEHLLKEIEVAAEAAKAPPPLASFDDRNVSGVPADHPVWFASNRLGYLSTKAADDFQYGRVDVQLPDYVEKNEKRPPWFLRWQEANRIRLEQVITQNPHEFWPNILEPLEEEETEALLYIHGYRDTFFRAARGAATIAARLQINGPTVLFSWPAQAYYLGYLVDGNKIDQSREMIAEFIRDFASRTDASKIHVVAHSMGNRGLIEALNHLGKQCPKLGQIILAAPDVDRTIFLNRTGILKAASARATLYASKWDVAVGLSRLLHLANRAGYSPEPTVSDNFDSMLVRGFDCGIIGHSYHANSPEVIEDMREVMHHGLPPGERSRDWEKKEVGSHIQFQFK